MEGAGAKGNFSSPTAEELKSIKAAAEVTCLVVVHPVQHDLGRPVPAGRHIPCHLVVRVPRQPEVQDLGHRKDIL